MIRIAVVEDEEPIRTGLVDNLEFEGFEVEGFGSAEALMDAIKGGRGNFDMFVVDIMLPGKDGIWLGQWLRSRSIADPIVYLTARSAEEDKLRGFQSGGDDYITKPFSVRELLARMQAVLRRSGKTQVRSLAFGPIEVDFQRHTCTRAGQPVDLTRTEFALLKLLADNAGVVVSRDVLLAKVWGYAPGCDTRTVDVHVSHLRKKIEENPEAPRHILTVRGVGYRLMP